jgi:hypothetical protein
MAVQFIKPVESEYQSQFVPLPLDFIYTNIEAKQKGLEETRTALNNPDIPVKAPFWAEQQGAVEPIVTKYKSQINDLSAQLEKDKGNFTGIASNLGKISTNFKEDPDVKKLARQKDLADKMDLTKIAGGTAYFPTLQYVDPTTQEIKFRNWKEINDEDIVQPINDDTQNYVYKQVIERLKEQASTKHKVPNAYVFQDKASGAFIIMDKPGGYTLEEIQISNPIIKQAVKSAASLIFDDNSGQAMLLKTFKDNKNKPAVRIENPDGSVKVEAGKGYNTYEDILKYVTEVLDISSHEKSKEIPAEIRVETAGTVVDPATAGGGVTPEPVDYDYTTVPGPVVDVTGTSNYSQNIGDLQLSIERAEATAFNEYLKKLAPLAASNTTEGRPAYNLLMSMDEILNQLLADATINTKNRAIELFRDGDSQGNEYTLVSILQDKHAARANKVLVALMDELSEEGQNKSAYKEAREKFFSLMNGLADSPNASTQAIAEEFFKLNTEITDKKLVLANLQDIEEKIGKTIISEAFKDAQFKQELEKIYPDANVRNNVIKALEENGGDNNTALQFYKALGGDKYELSILDPDIGNYVKGIFSSELEQQYLGQARDLTNQFGYDKLYDALNEFRQRAPVNAKIQQEIYIRDLGTTDSKKSEFKTFLEEQKVFYNANPQNLLSLFQTYGYTGGRDIGKTNLNLNDVREVFNNAILKSPNFALAEDDEVKVSDVNLGSLGESSLPILYFTVKDKSGNSSTVPITLPNMNKYDLSKFITSFVQDDNPNVQDKGAEIYARVLLSPSSISSVSTALAITENSDKLEGQIVKFKLGQEPYAIKINGQNSATIGKLVNDVAFAPLSSTKTKGGAELPVNVSNFSQFLKFMGYHQMGYLEAQGDMERQQAAEQRQAQISTIPSADQMYSGGASNQSSSGVGGSTGGLGKYKVE